MIISVLTTSYFPPCNNETVTAVCYQQPIISRIIISFIWICKSPPLAVSTHLTHSWRTSLANLSSWIKSEKFPFLSFCLYDESTRSGRRNEDSSWRTHVVWMEQDKARLKQVGLVGTVSCWLSYICCGRGPRKRSFSRRWDPGQSQETRINLSKEVGSDHRIGCIYQWRQTSQDCGWGRSPQDDSMLGRITEAILGAHRQDKDYTKLRWGQLGFISNFLFGFSTMTPWSTPAGFRTSIQDRRNATKKVCRCLLQDRTPHHQCVCTFDRVFHIWHANTVQPP